MRLIALSSLVLGACSAVTYPPTRPAPVVDDYHGIAVADPYRWLEDPDSAETRAWVAAQNRVTFDFLAKRRSRAHVRARLASLWDYEKYGVPAVRGGRTFFTYNPGLLNQSQVYVLDEAGSEPRLLLDPNTLSVDGTVALAGFAISDDGRWVAYAVSRSGSDWREWYVRDVVRGIDLADHVQWSKFSGASFDKEGKGFYYSAYDPPETVKEQLTGVNYFHKLYYHRLGTAQSEDRLVYSRPDQKEWGFEAEVTDDGRYLVISVTRGTDPRNAIFYLDLATPDAVVTPLIEDFDAAYAFVGSDDTRWFLRTDLDASRGRVIAIDVSAPQRERWRVVIPEATETLDTVTHVGGRLVAHYLADAHSEVRVFAASGNLERRVELPGLGTASGLDGLASDRETFFSFESFSRPATIYRLDVASGAVQLFRSPRLRFDPDDYVTTQVFLTSRDGTRLPMFISHKKGLKPQRHTPTYLYGYGGFNISLTPWFSASNLAWMQMGGVLAVPTLRGGGEYGESWHQAGTKSRKQNVFDDFAAAGEWLVAHGQTSPAKLAIGGGSNGGLLVGASLTQHPELFGAAVARVGVLDMLRYHRFTIGWAWASDYGTSDNADEFRALYAYSPLHNVRRGTSYPATLLMTGDHDDRVVPAHSFKFAATLQAAQAGPQPVLIRIDTKAGHGAGKPTDKLIDEAADMWAFVLAALGEEGRVDAVTP